MYAADAALDGHNLVRLERSLDHDLVRRGRALDHNLARNGRDLDYGLVRREHRLDRSPPNYAFNVEMTALSVSLTVGWSVDFFQDFVLDYHCF